MQISKVILWELKIPLRFQFAQANNATQQSHSALLELQLMDGTSGYGESCPRPYVTGEDMQTVKADIQAIQHQIEGLNIQSIEDIRLQLQSWASQVGSSTLCALELALLDAWSKTQSQPLGQLLGIKTKRTLSYSLILPLVKKAHLEGLFQLLRGIKPPKIKLKVDNQHQKNLEKIRFIQSYFGPEVPVRVDVNNGWTLEEAQKFIPDYLSLGVSSFEQTLATEDLEGLKTLTRIFGHEASIMADEALTSFEKATYLLEHKICNHFNLKISKLGGIFHSLEVYKKAAQFGIPCQLGAHFGETSILTTAGILLANLAGEMTAYEGAMGDFLLEKDITATSIRHQPNGQLNSEAVLQQIGIGGNVRKAIIQEFGAII